MTKEYGYSRLCFKADEIEPLADGDAFEVVTPEGRFVMTKRDFYRVFSNVVRTRSYIDDRIYHYPDSEKGPAEFLHKRPPIRSEVEMIYKIPLLFEPQPEGGFTVTSPALPGLITEGDTAKEAWPMSTTRWRRSWRLMKTSAANCGQIWKSRRRLDQSSSRHWLPPHDVIAK